MGFFGNLLNKIRQNPEDQAQTGGILPAANMTNTTQSGNALTDAINTAMAAPVSTPVVNRPQMSGSVIKDRISQPLAAPPVNETIQAGTPQLMHSQTPEQSVMSGLKNRVGGSNLNPNNWTENTRNGVLSVLNGVLNSNYDPNLGLLGSLGEGAVKGRQNYINYNNSKRVFGDYGLDTAGMSPFADYSQMTPDKLVTLGIRNQQNIIRQNIANAKTNTGRIKILMDGLKNNTIEPVEAQAQAKLYGIDFGSLQESNQTRATDSKVKLDGKREELIDSQKEVNKSRINLDNARVKKINADIIQNKQRIGILQQRVSQGRATSSDKAVLNQLNIQNKKLLIEQNSLINQGTKDKMGGGSARPVGQKGGRVF